MRAAGMEPDAWQQRVATTPGDQLLLCHRQIGKSTIAASIALGDVCAKPNTLVLLLSPSLRQSGELFRKVRTFYNQTKPLPLVRDTELSMELSNHSRILSLPGTESTIVGYSSVARLILDEASRIPDSTYYAVRPMLAMSGGSLLALSTPFGQRGWFWEAWEGQQEAQQALDTATVEALLADLGLTVAEDSARDDARSYQWTRTKMTALDNPRLSPRFLANERRSIPDLWFRQEWLCEFVALGDAVFRPEDIALLTGGYVTPLPLLGQGEAVLTERLTPLPELNGWPTTLLP